MLQLQIASYQSALRSFLNLLSFSALHNCFFSVSVLVRTKYNAMLSSLEGYRRKTISELLSINYLSRGMLALHMQCSA